MKWCRVVLFIAFAGVATVGCAPTRYAQCSEMFAIANGVVEQTRTQTADGETKEPEAMLAAAESLQGASASMAALNVSDGQLETYRDRYAELYGEMAAATAKFVEARKSFDRDRAEAAKERIEAVSAAETDLVENLNDYCEAQ